MNKQQGGHAAETSGFDCREAVKYNCYLDSPGPDLNSGVSTSDIVVSPAPSTLAVNFGQIPQFLHLTRIIIT